MRIVVLLLLLIFCSCESFQGAKSTEPHDPSSVEKRFSLGGAPVEVVINLSQKKIAITDSLKITVRVEYGDTVQIIPPYLSESVYHPLMLIAAPTEDTKWSRQIDRMESRWQYQFEPVTSGEFTLKPFALYFRIGSEKPASGDDWPIHKIETEAISYTVISVDIDEGEDIRDIKGLILPEYNFRPVIITALIIGFSLVLLMVLRHYRYLWEKDPIPAEAKIDFYLEALRQLKALEAQDLISEQNFYGLHTQLSSILRSYIENFFGIRAQEQTTEEFIKGISHSSIFTREQQQMLHQFLKLADLVKFATFDPGANTSSEAMQGVRSFIDDTGNPNEI